MPATGGRLPRKLTKFHVDPYLLQHQNAFLGFSSRRMHPAAYNYLLGTAGGQAIINPEETLVAMRRVLHLLKKVSFRGGRTLFVSTQPTLARLCRVVGEQSGEFYLARRWVPGLLTNWEKSREHIHAKLRPDPLLQAAGLGQQALWLYPVVLLGGLLTLVGLSRAGSTLFWRQTPEAASGEALDVWRLLAVLLLLAGSPLLVIAAAPLLDYLQAAAAQLLSPERYIEAVMSLGEHA